MDNRKSEVLIVPKKPLITVEGRAHLAMKEYWVESYALIVHVRF